MKNFLFNLLLVAVSVAILLIAGNLNPISMSTQGKIIASIIGLGLILFLAFCVRKQAVAEYWAALGIAAILLNIYGFFF